MDGCDTKAISVFNVMEGIFIVLILTSWFTRTCWACFFLEKSEGPLISLTTRKNCLASKYYLDHVDSSTYIKTGQVEL